MSETSIQVRQATVLDLDLLVSLFDAYRIFYRQDSDPEGARSFLLARFEHNQSIIFIAFDGTRAIGFTQLYPLFSSTFLARIFLLNDLFVTPAARGKGVGAALLRMAADYGRRVGATRLTLSTEVSNAMAQALYESLGWKRDNVFCVYRLALD